MTRLTKYSNVCNVLDSSRCMWYQKILEIMLPFESTPTWKYTSFYVFHLCKSTPPLTIHLCKSTPPFTFLIWLDMTMMHGHTSKDSTMQNHLTYVFTNNNVKVHLHLHWLVHQQLHYQVFTSTQSTSHNSENLTFLTFFKSLRYDSPNHVQINSINVCKGLENLITFNYIKRISLQWSHWQKTCVLVWPTRHGLASWAAPDSNPKFWVFLSRKPSFFTPKAYFRSHWPQIRPQNFYTWLQAEKSFQNSNKHQIKTPIHLKIII